MQSTAFGRVQADWELRALPDVLFFQEGPGLRRWQWTEAGMKVINGKNILADGSIDISNTERFIALDEFEKRYQHFAIDIGDIVVTSSGTIGKVARIRAEHLPMMMNTSVIRIRSLDSAVLADEFVFAFLRSPLFAAQADVAATGAAQRNFGPIHLKQMQVPVPPLRAQRKIGAVIAAYDEIIDSNLRRIEILEEMAQAVHREWLVHLRFPGHEGVDLVDSPLGPIPEGWEARKFGTIADEIKDGVDPLALEADVRYVGLEHIPQESFTLMDWGSATDVRSRKWRFASGDVLFGKLRPYFHKVAVAGFEGICSTDAIVIRPLNGFEDLALQVVFSKEFVAHAVATSGGTDRPRSKWADLANFDVVVPDVETRAVFSGAMRPMVDLAANLARQNANLRTTRDLLLPKLVSGEIDVSELGIDTEWLAS